MATLPTPDVLPEPGELFEFAQKLLNSQQQFFKDQVAGADPVSFLGSLKAAGDALLHKPGEVAAANVRFAIGLDAAARHD